MSMHRSKVSMFPAAVAAIAREPPMRRHLRAAGRQRQWQSTQRQRGAGRQGGERRTWCACGERMSRAAKTQRAKHRMSDACQQRMSSILAALLRCTAIERRSQLEASICRDSSQDCQRICAAAVERSAAGGGSSTPPPRPTFAARVRPPALSSPSPLARLAHPSEMSDISIGCICSRMAAA